MKLRGAVTPVALVAMAASTVAYAYFVDRGRISDADREARRRDVFPSFRVEDVRRVELVHGAEMTVIEREARPESASWVMRSPRVGATDAAAVDALLRELEMAPRVRDVQEADALGLAAPRVRGRITVGLLEYAFELGADAPRPEGAAYMRVEGEGTFVAGRSLKVQLLRGADTYRERTVVPYGASDVAKLAASSRGSPGFTLFRSGASFRVGSAGGVRAARAAVDRLFAALADTRADAFPADDVVDRATAVPGALTVTITPVAPGSPRVTLLVGGPCPSEARDVVVLRTEPTRLGACVAKQVAEALAASAGDLVDDAPFFAHADEMEEIRLESLGADPRRVDLARRGNGWHERTPDDRELSSDEVDAANALSLALASSKGASARAPAPGEAFAPRARATIVRTGGASQEVVEIADVDASGSCLARRAEDGAMIRLDRAVARRLEPHPVALRSLVVAGAPFDPGAVVAIDDTCSDAPQHLEMRDGLWRTRAASAKAAASPAPQAADAAAVSDMLGAVARLKADAWIAEADDGTFGFGRKGACSVTMTLRGSAGADGAKVGVVFAGADDRSGSEVYGHLVGDPAVFLAPAAVREIVSHPPVDRSRFQLEPSAASRVTLARGGAKLVLVHPGESGGGLRRVGGGEADEERDGKLEAALAAFYAQAALHTGAATAAEGLDAPMLTIDALLSPDGGPPTETRIAVGAPAHDTQGDGYFARAAGVDATFLVPRRVVDAILDGW